MKLFEAAEIAKFTPEQKTSYRDSLKYYRDLKNSLDTAKEESLTKVVEESLRAGIDRPTIARISGFSLQKIEEIAEDFQR